jgi:hypothetical protein
LTNGCTLSLGSNAWEAALLKAFDRTAEQVLRSANYVGE